MLEDETDRDGGSTAGIKTEESSGEGRGSGSENSSRDNQEVVPRPPALQTPVTVTPVKLKTQELNNNTRMSPPPLQSKPRNVVQRQKKPPQVAKKISPAKHPATDKRFSKLIGSSVACRLAGKKGLNKGTLRWVGHLPQMPLDNAHLIAGVELLADNKLGTDGTYRGVRYFKSSPNRGYFFRLKDCKAMKH